MAFLIGATSRILVSLATTATIAERGAGLRDRNLLAPFSAGRLGTRTESTFAAAIPRLLQNSTLVCWSSAFVESEVPVGEALGDEDDRWGLEDCVFITGLRIRDRLLRRPARVDDIERVDDVESFRTSSSFLVSTLKSHLVLIAAAFKLAVFGGVINGGSFFSLSYEVIDGSTSDVCDWRCVGVFERRIN
jgi:hypothetical protein